MAGRADSAELWLATATDQEGGAITWSLSGDDQNLFELTDDPDEDEIP